MQHMKQKQQAEKTTTTNTKKNNKNNNNQCIVETSDFGVAYGRQLTICAERNQRKHFICSALITTNNYNEIQKAEKQKLYICRYIYRERARKRNMARAEPKQPPV